jgi:hypothetical protein
MTTRIEQELNEMRHEAAELLASSRELRIRSAQIAAKAYALEEAVARVSIALREDAKKDPLSF